MADFRIIRVYPKKNLRRSQKWWVAVDHVNGDHLLRGTEGYANRSEALRLALDTAKTGDDIEVTTSSGMIVSWTVDPSEPFFIPPGMADL